MKGERILFGVSLGLLVLIAAAIIYGSLGSVSVALLDKPDRIGNNITFDQLRGMGAEDAVQAIRARRLTAATWTLGYAVLFTWVVPCPDRRMERWAWWVLLASLVISQIISIARVLFIGTSVGTLASALLLAFGLLGLLAGAPRFFLRRTDLL